MMTKNELIAAKKFLRARILAARDAMPIETRQVAADAITARLCQMPEYRQAKTVLTYMSFGTELDTHAFFDRVLSDGKVAVLPRIDKPTKSLSLHRVKGHADLVDGVWGIREPRADAPKVSIDEIDLVLMPGLAFDRSGNRLGYGAGFYDRLLSRSAETPFRIAAAFNCQIVDVVPTDAQDRRCHCVVTESQLLQIAT